jgi:hypothetical protein
MEKQTMTHAKITTIALGLLLALGATMPSHAAPADSTAADLKMADATQARQRSQDDWRAGPVRRNDNGYRYSSAYGYAPTYPDGIYRYYSDPANRDCLGGYDSSGVRCRF